MNNNFAIICARAGSKRVPNKNIRDFNGQNIVQRAVIAALDSKIFSKIYISSDSNNILKSVSELNSEAGKVVTHLRPSELGRGNIFVRDVVIDCLLNKPIKTNDRIWVLFPTCPLRKSKTLVEACKYSRMLEYNEQLVSVSRTPVPWQVTFSKGEKYLEVNHPSFYQQSTRHDDYPANYFANFVFVNTTLSILQKEKTLISPRAVPFITDYIESIDIDEEEDWNFAKELDGYLSNEKNNSIR